uniref:Uncharacterized protein n=1 Tax=Arundo donax TaxID=35708 RepID=A0A0A9FTI1_ARUDO
MVCTVSISFLDTSNFLQWSVASAYIALLTNIAAAEVQI